MATVKLAKETNGTRVSAFPLCFEPLTIGSNK